MKAKVELRIGGVGLKVFSRPVVGDYMKAEGELCDCERCKGKGCRACHGHGIVAVLYKSRGRREPESGG